MKTKITTKLFTMLCLTVLLILPLKSQAQRNFYRNSKFQNQYNQRQNQNYHQRKRWNMVPRMDSYNSHNCCTQYRCNRYNRGGSRRIFGMNDQVFQSLQQSMNSATFDRNKLSVAKMAIRSNRINVNQLRSLMRGLSFDRNKLELAKFALPYTVDQNLLFTLSNELTFYSSRRTLMNHISNKVNYS
jgi:hypothetical protein